MAEAIKSQRLRGRWLLVIAILILPSLLLAQEQLDPAAWGSDHVGKPLPEFTSGDECLFCHRMDVGPTWGANRHGQTVRLADPQSPALAALAQQPALQGLAADVELLLGASHRVRFLKRSQDHGKLDLLSAEWAPAQPGTEGKLLTSDRPSWDSRKFGDSCAGCHTTGVSAEKRTFAALSLECYVCHGEVPEKHTTNGSLVYLSPKRHDSARAIASLCGQCHLRTGKANSSGLPYPNNFVAGDNLFRDFRVDLSLAAIDKLNPADRHVQQNVRDVALLGKQDVTCLSCHDVHRQSSQKHQRLADGSFCLNCHQAGSKQNPPSYQVHSKTCGY
jgi:hypothetical protein